MESLERESTQDLLKEVKRSINVATSGCAKIEDKQTRACVLNLCIATQSLRVVLDRVTKNLEEINSERGV